MPRKNENADRKGGKPARKTSRRPDVLKDGAGAPVQRRHTLTMSGVVLRMRNPHARTGHPNILFANSVGEPIRTQICLCYGCRNFDPNRRDKNCEIANELFDTAVKYDVAVPVTRCPKFKPVDGVDVV
jgi:hypothetical protein